MRLQAALSLLSWCVACLLAGAAAPASAAPELPVAGVALHRETGRDIYLGALYAPAGTHAGGPRLMEYRVVARRTSMRSLLGGMLLQSEVASGHPPDDTTRQFAAAVLAAVRGSLYAGDVLGILLTGDAATAAYLNGHEIIRVDERGVADYLLLGWIGEHGPATAFRDALLARAPDPQLLAQLRAIRWSAQRAAEVAAWLEPARDAAVLAQPSGDSGATAAQQTAAAAPPAPATVTAAPATRDAAAAVAAAPTASAGDFALVEVSAVRIRPRVRAAVQPLLQVPQPSAAGAPPTQAPPRAVELRSDLQTAAVSAPSPPPSAVAAPVAALDVEEYSRRLAQFNTRLINAVYRQVRYPGRAVRRGMQGRVELDVVLDPTGALLEVIVARSSGYPALDEAGVEAAHKAVVEGKFEAIDPVASAEYSDDDDRLVIPVPISFVLTE